MFYRYTRCRPEMMVGLRPYSVYSGCRVRELAYLAVECRGPPKLGVYRNS